MKTTNERIEYNERFISTWLWKRSKLYRDYLLWLNTYRYKKWIQQGLQRGFFSRHYVKTEEYFSKLFAEL